MKKAMLANVSEEYAFRVIDPAVVPEERASPKRSRIAMLGLLIGGLLGTLSAFVLNVIRRQGIGKRENANVSESAQTKS